MCAGVIHLGWKFRKENCADHVCKTHGKITAYHKFTAAYLINDHHEEEFTNQAND
jgi:hypothetical protein